GEHLVAGVAVESIVGIRTAEAARIELVLGLLPVAASTEREAVHQAGPRDAQRGEREHGEGLGLPVAEHRAALAHRSQVALDDVLARLDVLPRDLVFARTTAAVLLEV